MQKSDDARSSADAKRAGSGRRGHGPYFAVPAAALVATLLCLYFWTGSKDAALTALRIEGTARMDRAAESAGAFLRTLTKRGRTFASRVSSAGSEEIDELPRTLFDDPDTLAVRLCLESDPARNRVSLDIRYGRDGDTVRREADKENADCENADSEDADFENVNYQDTNFPKLDSLSILPVVKTKLDLSSLFSTQMKYGISPQPEKTGTAVVRAPVAREGKTVGQVVIQTDLREIEKMLYDTFAQSNAKAYLIGSDGTIALGPERIWGDDYRNVYGTEGVALRRCAVIVSEENGGDFVDSDGGLFALCVPVDAGEGTPLWFLASLYDLRALYRESEKWLIAVFVVWFAALLATGAIFVVRNVRRVQVESETTFSKLPPEKAEIFRRLGRRRMVCYVLAALFCIPVILYLRASDRRWDKATADEDVEAAERVLSGMTCAALAGVLIGCFFLACCLNSSI